jgi:hypothetical protein
MPVTLNPIHVRTQHKGDRQPWEDIDPITLHVPSYMTPADYLAQIYHDAFNLEEIRWNWAGSLQGHYYRP